MFRAMKMVVSELFHNRYRLWRLAIYELKTQNSGTMFGFLWNFLNPVLQIFVYWFVFAIGLNASAPRGGYPYIIWMITGIIPWFYMSIVLTTVPAAIYGYSGILKRMQFPMAVVPVKTVLAQLVSHLLGMLVVFAVILLSGYAISWRVCQLPYFILCSFVFLVAYSLFSSAVTVVFKDFQKFISSVVRLLFYISPVVWTPERIPEGLRMILKLNPFAYIIDGYRESILYGYSLLWHWKQGVYFWCVTLLLFAWGCSVHMKLRRQFMDLI